MEIYLTDNGRPAWGELLVDATFAHEPILYYKDSLWSAEAALRERLRFSHPISSARSPDAPVRRLWIFAVVRAAIIEQTSWRRLARTAIRRFLTGMRER